MTPAELSVAAALAVVAGIAVHREWRRRRIERAFDTRFRARRNAQGIIEGAEAFTLKAAGTRAVVLLHGYNDSPQTMRAPAAALHAAGWSVYVPLLPGHGRSLRAFAQSGAERWLAASRDAVREALERHRTVVVGGLSLGGAIATIMAAEEPRVAGAVLFAPFLVQSRRLSAIANAWPLLQLFFKYLTGGGAGRSVRDPEARAPHRLRLFDAAAAVGGTARSAKGPRCAPTGTSARLDCPVQR